MSVTALPQGSAVTDRK